MAADAQRKRLKEEGQKQLEGDLDMAEGDLIARVRWRSEVQERLAFHTHCCILGHAGSRTESWVW